MPYVAGQGYKMGLALGQAQAEWEKEKSYQADRARAQQEHEEDRALDEADRMASQEEGRQRIGEMEQEQLQDASGLAPDQYGPPSPAALVRQKVISERMARVQGTAAKMQPAHRERYLQDEKALMQQAAYDRPRRKVATGMQDRLSHGGYNLLDETEPPPAILERVESLMQALDSKDVDPLKAAEIDAGILEAVRTENQRRLERKRGTTMIEQHLGRAVDSGNTQLASDLEAIHAMWGTGELKPDDLIDRLFEAQYGRKTARAAGPTPFQVRQEAMKLWATTAKDTRVLPSEKELAPFIELLNPTPVGPLPTKRTVVEGAPKANARGTDVQGGSTWNNMTPEEQAAHNAGTSVERPSSASSKNGSAGPAKTSVSDAASGERPAKQGGEGIRPWANLSKSERGMAVDALAKAWATGGDLDKVAKGLGFDPATLTAKDVAEIKAAAKKLRTRTQSVRGGGHYETEEGEVGFLGAREK